MFPQCYFVFPVQVCEAVKECSGLSEQLLHILDDFSVAGPLGVSGTPEVLYSRLSSVLQPWPQLLKDFAAFLNRGQARRCGLVGGGYSDITVTPGDLTRVLNLNLLLCQLLEHRLFERSRRFLRRLGRNLGENSLLYQEVVCVLQGSSAPSTEDIDKVSLEIKSRFREQSLRSFI